MQREAIFTRLCLFLFSLSMEAFCQDVPNPAVTSLLRLSRSCGSNDAPQPCQQFPPVNLMRPQTAPLTRISANSTCSDEVFCSFSNITNALECSSCTAEQFAATKLTDQLTSDEQRWQSANLDSAQDAVTLDISFGGLPNLLISSVTLDQAQILPFIAPGAIDVLLSSDHGETYRTGGHFRQNCLGITPCVTIPGQGRDIYTLTVVPVESVAAALQNPASVQSLLDNNPFVTDVRVVFRELSRDRKEANESLFYSLTEISVTAYPYCSGHGWRNNLTNPIQTCLCEHGTSGSLCTLCRDMPIAPATIANVTTCPPLPTTTPPPVVTTAASTESTTDTTSSVSETAPTTDATTTPPTVATTDATTTPPPVATTDATTTTSDNNVSDDPTPRVLATTAPHQTAPTAVVVANTGLPPAPRVRDDDSERNLIIILLCSLSAVFIFFLIVLLITCRLERSHQEEKAVHRRGGRKSIFA